VVNHEYVASLGATPVAYGDGLIERPALPRRRCARRVGRGRRAGLTRLDRHSIALVRDRNRIATLVDHELADGLGGRGVRAQRSSEQLNELVYQRGTLHILIRATFSLEKIVEAHPEVEIGHGRGKVVVVLGG